VKLILYHSVKIIV